MQKITLFHFEACPYCREARAWMQECIRKNPAYAQLEIELIDERLQPALADQYDYYYVPTFYVGGEKVHEGAATRAIVDEVLSRALNG